MTEKKMYKYMYANITLKPVIEKKIIFVCHSSSWTEFPWRLKTNNFLPVCATLSSHDFLRARSKCWLMGRLAHSTASGQAGEPCLKCHLWDLLDWHCYIVQHYNLKGLHHSWSCYVCLSCVQVYGLSLHEDTVHDHQVQEPSVHCQFK